MKFKTSFSQEQLSAIDNILKLDSDYKDGINDYVNYLLTNMIENKALVNIKNPGAIYYQDSSKIKGKLLSPAEHLTSSRKNEYNVEITNAYINAFPSIFKDFVEDLSMRSFWTIDRIVDYYFNCVLTSPDEAIDTLDSDQQLKDIIEEYYNNIMKVMLSQKLSHE